MEQKIERCHKVLLNFIPSEVRPKLTELMKVMDSQYRDLAITEWQGYRFTPPALAKIAEWQYANWYPTVNDVLIASYPKTGTTWLTQIVKKVIYMNDTAQMAVANAVTQLHSYLENASEITFEVMQKLPWKRLIWETHYPAPIVNMDRVKKTSCKVIYIVRNPKDQLVSWFHMSQRIPTHRMAPINSYYPADWVSFFDFFINGKQPNYARKNEWYPDHILSWYAYRNEKNVLFVMYEDLKEDPAKEIRKIANFLGVERSYEEIEKIVEATSFQTMKEEASPLTSSMNAFTQRASW
ncbi:sulfotransferase 1C3-like [Clavelina lepadiformis]|uniref:sulfotransferase 1C3-like n=1 Tax=Clavelina lepadiformis TaxID=159417 RepID=UPI004042FB32